MLSSLIAASRTRILLRIFCVGSAFCLVLLALQIARAGSETRSIIRDNSLCGRSLVKDINTSDQNGAYPSRLTFLNDKLFFLATDGDYNLFLWVSNGTARGYHQAKANIRRSCFQLHGGC